MFKGKIFFIFYVFMLLMGCTSEESEPPSETVKKMLNDVGFNYSTIYHVEETKDGIVTFFQPKDRDEFVGYGFIANHNTYEDLEEKPLKEIFGDWQWVSRGVKKWTDFGFNGGGDEPPYAYYGTITDPDIHNVTLNEEDVEIVNIGDNQRFWYYFGDEKWVVPIDEGLKALSENGEVIHWID